ncbi:hypothetical protein C8A03DRAFT_29490 [Achaetomium macrosporum]|uniref:Uncharacterized protein n=1 Tax=Achaetomium macrosporum TaxID=79813 RepID=A0AAN7HHL4_9PEZI|nr:hypothetical protein C8A03DRAFT_29490 [Achaetomium macrosporum]
MAITVKACHLCMTEVKTRLDSMGIPYTTSGNTLTVNCSSPSKWPETSLMATCWRGLQFAYHAATRNGNTIKCTNCR